MVKSCHSCKRLFEDFLNAHTLCPECRAKEEQLLRDVKDYLWSNPGTTEVKLCELFEVTHEQIMLWLRSERLEIMPDSAIKLTCVRCGSMISSGKYCADCKKRIKDDLGKMKDDIHADKENTQHTAGMVVDKSASKNKLRFLGNSADIKK